MGPVPRQLPPAPADAERGSRPRVRGDARRLGRQPALLPERSASGWLQSHPEWTAVVGQLGATLPLEVDLGQDGDFWSRGQRLQTQLWRDLEHSEVTAVRVMREVAARRGWTSRAILPYVFNSMLGLGAWPARRPAGRIASGGLRTPHVLVDNQVQDMPDGGIECTWDTVDDAFPPGLPVTMFAAYERMLRALAAPDGAEARPDPVPPEHRDTVAVINRPEIG